MKNKTLIKGFMVLIVITAVVMFVLAWTALPSLANFSADTFTDVAHLAKPVNYYVLLSAIPFFLILYEIFKICNYIIKDEIFSAKPSISLKRISILAYILGVMYIVLTLVFLFNKFMTPLLILILSLVVFASVTVGTFALIMNVLVIKAYKLQEEHDLTV